MEDEEPSTKVDKFDKEASKEIDSRIKPIKKGQFYEHDNRDGDEDANNPDGPKSDIKKSSNDKGKPKRRAKPGKVDAYDGKSGDKEASDKWTHDLFEKQEKPKKQSML